MNASTPSGKTDARRLVEASAWKTKLFEAGQESTPFFAAWLADDDNRRAWDRIQASWDLISDHATAPEVLELRHKALVQVYEMARQPWGDGSFARRRVQHALAAALVVLAVGALLFWNWSRPQTYRTESGERRVVTLADGSQLQLDALTEVRVSYSEGARELTLLKGQARFDVAHHAGRPFSVRVGSRKVIATGTAFNVDLLGGDLFVTLIEGKVVILPQGFADDARYAGGNSIELGAGQQLTISTGGTSKVRPANVQRAVAWQRGQLVFDNEPLSAVLLRVNRYSKRPVHVADERAAALRLSGVFNIGDVEGFVTTIASYLPLVVERDEHSIYLKYRHAPPGDPRIA